MYVCVCPVSVLLWRSAQKTEIPKGKSGDEVERGGLFSKRGGKRASAIIVRGYI